MPLDVIPSTQKREEPFFIDTTRTSVPGMGISTQVRAALAVILDLECLKSRTANAPDLRANARPPPEVRVT